MPAAFIRNKLYLNLYNDLKLLPLYKDLLRNLVVKELRVKYRNSVLGYFWSLINPLSLILTFVIAFKYLIPNAAGRGEDFILRLVTGIIFFNFFSSTLTTSANSIVGAKGLISKVRFPRLVPVLSNHSFNLIQHLLVWPPLMIYLYGFAKCPITLNLLWFIPIFLLINIYFIGLSLILSTATVFFRDVKHFLQAIMRMLFWGTPIIYQLKDIPEKMWFMKGAPFTPFIHITKQVLLYGEAPNMTFLGISSLYAGFALLIGSCLFYSFQHRFVEEM